MGQRNIAGMRVIVTGASSGIGYALALQLALKGADVLATARRESRLDELQTAFRESPRKHPSQAGNIRYLAGDLTDPDFRKQLVATCKAMWPGLDVLVNNAGAGAIGRFEDASEHRMRVMMEVDFFAPVELTRSLLPWLRLGNKPAILNVGSVLSHRAVPLKSEYCAAKFAFRGWSEALRCELQPEHIDVLQLSPSTTRSEFFDSLVDTEPESKSVSYGHMLPDKVAQIAIRSLIRSRRDTILSLGGKGLVMAGRFFPSLLDRILVRSVMAKHNR